MAHIEKTMKSEHVYKGHIISVRVDEVELENGKAAMREVIEHPGGVCVLPLAMDDTITMVKQFRYPYKEEVLELPAGKRSPGEDPLECGRRELTEETGLIAARFKSLGELYPSPGYVDEVIYLYLATGLTRTNPSPDEDEFLDVCTMPLEKAFEKVFSGEIKDAKTQIALLKAYAMRQKGQI
ncbi:NUDIX domain-containing protein [Acetanaerobacterium elongatum]|uniref:ADP-ribose pyrophosphatase n=1 Tax=Acetanaerobacterium elongatum TaxID=258515 RepID=A0A1G9UKM7_9FIRM|nr:NUDIX hydrolase [Acetanaerobacterium elongatum]SDM60413.1 ADP-ribose pyrophosphatase [Acetanaerobacterium elongatum]